MKILFTIMTLLPIVLQAQKIEVDKVDDFTKHKNKQTSWEHFSKDYPLWGFIRVSNIDSSYILGLKVITGGVTSVREQDKIMIKTETDSIVSLINLNYQITCKGCGGAGFVGSDSEGLNLSFYLSNQSIEYLNKHRIVKIRLYTSNGFLEEDIKGKYQDILMKEIALIK